MTSRRSPTSTARRCGSPGCGRPVAAPTCGTSCTRRPRSSASSTTGWSPTATACSPATRSSICPPTARPLPGLNLCGAGRVVCLIDPVGDVYACPFAIHEQFLAGNILRDGGFAAGVAATPSCSRELRSPQTGGACAKCGHFDACRGGCMAAKFFTGLPMDGPDPECVQRLRRVALAADRASVPKPAVDHSRPVNAAPRAPVPLH